LRDGAAVARDLAAQMHATATELDEAAATGADAEGLGLIARRLRLATQSYEKAVDFTLVHGRDDLRAVFMGSVPFLMLAGVVHAGWQLGRAALACSRAQAKGSASDFHQRKLATSVFYAAWILPRAQAMADSLLEGVLVK